MTIGRQCLLVVLALLSFWSVTGCHEETEEDRIAKIITAVQKAAEKKNIQEMLSNISKKYHDPQGNDYQGIKGRMLFYFLRHRRISAIVSGMDIHVAVPSATASFQAILSGRTGSELLLPEALGAYRFFVSFERETGDWKITSAKWERFREALTAPPE